MPKLLATFRIDHTEKSIFCVENDDSGQRPPELKMV